MADIPAICSNCGLHFTSPNIFGGSGNAQIKFEDCGTTCPNCGYLADIPSGTYTVKDGVTQYFESNKFSKSELQTLSRIIKDAQKKKTSADELSKIIDKEIPKASGLKKFFLEGINLASVLGIILAMIGIYLTVKPPPKETIKKTPSPTYWEPVKPTKRETRRNRGKSKQVPPDKANKK